MEIAPTIQGTCSSAVKLSLKSSRSLSEGCKAAACNAEPHGLPPCPPAAGTRRLPMAVVGAVLQQPPLAVLVQQVLLMCECLRAQLLCRADCPGFTAWPILCPADPAFQLCSMAKLAVPPAAMPADITSDTAGFCASQLAAHTLSAARISAAVDTMEALMPPGALLTKPDALSLATAPSKLGGAPTMSGMSMQAVLPLVARAAQRLTC